ncbi:MAG: ribosome maturation factor RimP [Pseudomonadota bacterium]
MDLHQLVEKTLSGLGYELVELERSPRGRTLRLFIDKPGKEKGVDIDDCALVSNQLSRTLMVENVDYDRLEVSSPGLDRPLRKASDFERFLGSEIQLRLRIALAGRRNFNGILQSFQGTTVRVKVDANELEFDLSNIDKARLVPHFD